MVSLGYAYITEKDALEKPIDSIITDLWNKLKNRDSVITMMYEFAWVAFRPSHYTRQSLKPVAKKLYHYIFHINDLDELDKYDADHPVKKNKILLSIIEVYKEVQVAADSELKSQIYNEVPHKYWKSLLKWTIGHVLYILDNCIDDESQALIDHPFAANAEARNDTE